MKNFLKNAFRWARVHYIISAIVLVILLIIVSAFSFGGNGAEKITVERGTVVQTVQASGKMKPIQDADFGFENGGRVAAILVNTGDAVVAGAVLVELDRAQAEAELSKARGLLAADTAELDEMRAGTRSEELNISEAEKAEAEVALADATSNLVINMKRAFELSDNAVRNYADQFFENTDDFSPSWKRTYVSSGGTTVGLNVVFDLKLKIVDGRREVQKILPLWASLSSGLMSSTATPADLMSKISIEKSYLDTTVAFLEDLALGVNQMSSPNGDEDAVFAGFRTDVGTARANVATAYTNLIAAEDKYNAARLSFSVQDKELALKLAGSTSQALASQVAKVAQSRAGVLAAEADLSKAIIRAPFSGIVGTIDAEVGEVVGAGDTIIRLISEEDNFSIEANISEVNIAKINVGNKVRAVFDALPDQSFYGSVSHIDSTETIIDDVVNYKVTILVDSSAINDKTDKIKSGMTANLFVETAERQNVLIVPLFALTRSTEGGETKFVAQKLVGGSRSEETSVVLGVVGSDGRAEVLSGLSEGDVLVIEK